MPSSGLCSFENFHRLEDFPSYTSVIRCFGKPIIPPLLTAQEKAEIARFRASLMQHKKQVLRIPKDCLEFSENHKDSNKTDTDQISHQMCNSCIPYKESSNHEVSALNSSNLKLFNGSSFVNEMLVSMSKIPSGGICSTVHSSVIVCPNEIRIHQENPSSEVEGEDCNSEDFESCCENSYDCQSCQIKHVDPHVPYEDALAEQIQSVSDDEQGSVAEETEFESLPTVICNQIVPSQDTDSESIVTCMTQSTDLDKYMDCSIEFSSPDDPATISQSQMSNRVSMPSRSDDDSTETFVNTENELTPCASAMAELNDYTDESFVPPDSSTLSSAVVNNTNTRAYSVDSYMNVLRACARDFYLKKSQSEPSNTDANESQHCTMSSTANVIKKGYADFMPHFLKKKLENVEVLGDVDLPFTNNDNSNFDTVVGPVEQFERKHIRRNSYTLLQPSPALIKYHADCHCQEKYPIETSHSCSSGYQNVAFKKETLDFVLPATPDRQKMFPVLQCENPSNVDDDDLVSDSEGMSSMNATDDENCNNRQLSALDQNFQNAEKEDNFGSAEIVDDNERPLMMQDDLKTDNGNGVSSKLFDELKESYQLRFNQLIKEQNKQRLKLQEEFKHQERVLFENRNLKSYGICISYGENSVEPFPSASYVFLKNDVAEKTSGCTFDSSQLTSSDSNSTNLSSETEMPTIIQNNLSETKHFETSQQRTVYSYPHYSEVSAETDTEVLSNEYPSPTFKDKSINVMGPFNSLNLCDIKPVEEKGTTEHIQVGCSTNGDAILCDDARQLPQSPIYESNPSMIETHLSKPGRELIGEIEMSKDFSADHSWLKTSNLDNAKSSANIFLKQVEASTINKNNFPAQLSSDKNVNGDKGNAIVPSLSPNNNVKCSAAGSGDLSSSLQISKSKTQKCPTTAVPNQALTSNTQQMPHKSSVVSGVQAKATKLVSSSSLTNLKRRKSKDLNDPEMLKRFEKLPAFVKGYLARRLLKTERVQGLIKTMQETAMLMQNLYEELTLKGCTIAERDMELYNQLLAQLMASFEEVYNILCTISIKEKMKIISESRNFQLKKKMDEKLHEPSNSLVIDNPHFAPDQKPKLSSATVKSLQRRKRSVIDGRTYTIEDLREHRPRPRSMCSLKPTSTSSANIYQTSVGVNLSRKTKSLVKPTQHQHWK